MDSNLIHGPSAQNRWRSTRKVLKICLVLTIVAYFNFSWPLDQWHWKDYLLIFPCICRSPKSEVGRVLYVHLKARWSWTPSWTSTMVCVFSWLSSTFLISAPSWCPACSPWSTPWFLITIKSLGSNLFSRSLADEHKNEFTWRHSCYAHDLIIGPCNSIERIVVSDVVISSSLGAWHPPWWALSLVITTHTHDDFGCLSPRDYVDTKSWLTYEQNPYLTHWVRSSSCHREMSLSYDILPVVTRLRANTNISNNWHANPTSSLYDNTAMLWARGLHNFTIASTTLSCFAMWLYLTIPVIRSNSDGTIIRQYHLQAIVQKEKGLLKSAYAKIWSSTSVVHPRLEDSHFEDFKL
jgi:hypothetical protein